MLEQNDRPAGGPLTQEEPDHEHPDLWQVQMELTSVLRSVKLPDLIDEKHPDAALLEYLAYDQDKIEKLLEDPTLLRTPIVRNGKQATVGYQPDIWKGWE